MIWGVAKNEVAQNNKTFKLADMEILVENAINNITLESIQATFEHAKRTEEEFWKKDGLLIAQAIQNRTISIDCDDSSSSSASSDSDGEIA